MPALIRVSILLLLLSVLAACGGAESPPSADAVPAAGSAAEEPAAAPAAAATLSLADVAAGPHRSESNRARDAFRHPVETLEFFGLTPESHVVEIWPSGGWYTEVIAPYVNENGQFYAAHWDPESDIEFVRKGVAGYQEKLAANPEVYGNAKMTVLMPPGKTEIAPPDSVDLVVTFRSIHNWMPRGSEKEIFAAVFAALKPGGVLGVVEHRGDPDVEQDPKAASGYVNEAYAIALAEAAGFELDAKSEINANPADTKDYDTGVWTLPPTLRKKEEDKDKYLAIGESDRFTLKFRKPSA